nr:hypothetical protein [Tanacetum cinerariifolium]
FRVFNSRTRMVEENLHIKFLENKPNIANGGLEWLFDIDSLTISMNYEPVTAGNQTNHDASKEIHDNAGQAGQEKASDHEYILLPLMPLSTQDVNTVITNSLNINIVGPNDQSMPSLKETGIFNDVYDDREVGAEANINNLYPLTVVSPIPTTRVHKDHPKEQIIEPKKVLQALADPSWIEAMQEDILQFKLQKVWTMVDLPNGKRAIRTKWVFRNKKDERGIMDVKSAFLYCTIEEEVYVCQHPSFEDPHFPNKVKQKDDGMFISQDKYVVDILKKFDFSSVKTARTLIETHKALLRDEEAQDVDVNLYRLMIGSLMYLTASRIDIMFVVCDCARFQVTPKVSHLHDVKRILRYLKGHPKLGLWYP